MKPTVHVFDFDGTITTRDTFLAFCRYSAGLFRFCLIIFLHIPIIAGNYLHLISTQKAKETIFSAFFKGMSLSDFETLCRTFANKNKHLMQPSALSAIETAISKKEYIFIVSASIENYIIAFFEEISILVEATKIETDEKGFLTGKFLGKNCKGKEKVYRIIKHFPKREDYRLIAYGDSTGDAEMLAFADEVHYKPFRKKETAWKESLKEKIRFLFVGMLAVIIQYVSYCILIQFMNANSAFTIAFLVSLTVNFILSTIFTFHVNPSIRHAIGFCLSHAVNYTLQIILFELCIKIGIQKPLAPLPVYGICVPINFTLVRFFLTRP